MNVSKYLFALSEETFVTFVHFDNINYVIRETYIEIRQKWQILAIIGKCMAPQ